MERRKCTTASAAAIGVMLLLGTGGWWLTALERDRREFWEQDDLEEVEELASLMDLADPALVADQDRQAILRRLRTELGCQPTVLSWRPEPLWNLARRGVRVVRVTYQRYPTEPPDEGRFVVAKGRVLRLCGRPASAGEELKDLDRALGYLK